MMSCGVDSVDIARFAHFYTKKDIYLYRMFSPNEVAYCKAAYHVSAQRFAVRFAAKEALYKALCQLHQTHFSLLTLLRHTEIIKNPFPQLRVNWQHIAIAQSHVHVSLTHTATTATAMVIAVK
jgi:holo-[acyl-carrier protein] synthase